VKKVVLLGATKGMGRAIARQLAQRGDALFLLGRDPSDLAASARDIEIRSGRADGSIGSAPCDLERPVDFAPALDSADTVLGGFDTVVVTAGMFATQDRLEAEPDLARRLLTADFANTVVFCEEARRRLLARGGGTLCVFSSVAGERGRKPVVLYGAAKAGLTHYMEGLDHKFHDKGLRAICVKPGFVRTAMTAGLRRPRRGARDRSRAPGRLRAGNLALDHAGDPDASSLRDAQDRLLIRFLFRGRQRAGRRSSSVRKFRASIRENFC
jgi:NAD(P)-dependent dehydrogenase (short-subunit alcohol dehydrogenase family)